MRDLDQDITRHRPAPGDRPGLARSLASAALALAVIASSAAALASGSAGSAASTPEAATPSGWADGDGAAPTQGATCGGPGMPPCPMQAWMRSNVAAPLAANNSAALAVGLERVAGLNPDASWSSWSTIAMQGAAAAKKGDIPGARAACKACHDTWREQYRKKYRARPIPR